MGICPWRAGRDLNLVRRGDKIARASFFAVSFPFFSSNQNRCEQAVFPIEYGNLISGEASSFLPFCLALRSHIFTTLLPRKGLIVKLMFSKET